MIDYRCATCKGAVEATRKAYYTLREGELVPEDMGSDYDLYCASECFHESTGGADDPGAAALIEALIRDGRIEEGEPE